MTVSGFFHWVLTGEKITPEEKLLRLAKKGNVKAQFKLGMGHYTGHGLPLNEELAVSWFNGAAQQGHAKALFYLGHSRYFGRGSRREYESAYAWFSLAAMRGYRRAAQWQKKLSQSMTPGQLEEGRRLVHELKGRIRGLQARKVR